VRRKYLIVVPRPIPAATRRYLIVVPKLSVDRGAAGIARGAARCASKVLGRATQANARGAAQVFGRDAQAFARGAARCASQVQT
jgi:hypothetical protein